MRCRKMKRENTILSTNYASTFSHSLARNGHSQVTNKKGATTMPGLLFILFDEYSTFGVGFGGACLGLRIGSNVNLIGNYLDRGCCHEEDTRTRRNLLCATGISGARCKRTTSVGSTTARDIPVPRACRTRVPVFGAYRCFANKFRTAFGRTTRTSWYYSG